MSFPPGFGPPGGGPPPPGFIVGPATAVYQMKNISFALMTALIWDILTTTDKELVFLYRTPFSTMKFLWLLNRSLVPLNVGIRLLLAFMLPSSNTCTAFGDFVEWMGVVNLFVVQAALAFRVVALYHRATWVIAFVITILLGSTLSRIVIKGLNPVIWVSIPAPVGCIAFPAEIDAAAFYGPLIYDAILFVMTVVRIFPILGDDSENNHLFVLLYRDGAVYFFLVTVTMAMTITGFFVVPLLGPFTESLLFLGIISLACSRMILNLRDSARSSELTTASYNSAKYRMGGTAGLHIEMSRIKIASSFSSPPSTSPRSPRPPWSPNYRSPTNEDTFLHV